MSQLGDILILGLGSSGEACARYCAALLGTEVSSVTVVDGADGERQRAIADELAGLGVRVALGVPAVDGDYDLCIASPGIPPHAGLMRSASEVSGEVISEIEFAFRRSSNPWVAVTGTNGKTTTTALVTHLLVAGGTAARAVGNIGAPAITAVAEAGPHDVLVAEVSSFQLALTSTFHPRCAVLLNITPDHIDWHGSMEAYATDKARVFTNLAAGDTAVIDVDDPGSAAWVEPIEGQGVTVVRVCRDSAHPGGASAHSGMLALDNAGGPIELTSADRLRILGPHNVSNALAAAAAAHAMGVARDAIVSGLESFNPIEHRLEPAGEVAGVEWFNDSKATNPDAVIKAIESFEDRPIILLVGGRNKGNSFDELAGQARDRVRIAIAFGEAREDLTRSFTDAGIEVHEVAGMADAVREASALASPGDAVVLSPACASFDEFSSYEHRGRVFKAAVTELQGATA